MFMAKNLDYTLTATCSPCIVYPDQRQRKRDDMKIFGPHHVLYMPLGSTRSCGSFFDPSSLHHLASLGSFLDLPQFRSADIFDYLVVHNCAASSPLSPN